MDCARNLCTRAKNAIRSKFYTQPKHSICFSLPSCTDENKWTNFTCSEGYKIQTRQRTDMIEKLLSNQPPPSIVRHA